MTRRRAVGLPLLCALSVCALAASSAGASRGTTAFNCATESSPTEVTIGFEDEHCTKVVFGESAKQVHEELKPETKTQLSITNTTSGKETVNPRLKATFFGVKVELEAKKFTSCKEKATVENKLNGSSQMEAAGEFCGEFTGVTVSKPTGCVVKEPITLNEKGQGKTVVKEPKAGQYEMYVEFTPASKVFTTIAFEGEKCALKGIKMEVTGTAKATVTTEEGCVLVEGPKLQFTTAGTEGTLKVGGSNAMFEGTFTARKAPEGEKEGNPVVLTTTNN
jgi:hypothetical protein